MMMVDADGKTWGIFKPFKKAWNYAWDKANQFARWAEENGIPSAGIGMNYNNGSGFSPNANVNGQPLDLSGEIASINRGVAGVNYSFYSQMNNYRAHNRARIPLIYVEPIIFNGAWVVPYGEDLSYQTLEQAIETNAWKEWHRRSSGRVEVTDSPIDYIIGAGLGKAIIRRTIARSASKGVRNIIPRKVARVIPANINSRTLGSPGALDVFVTASDDIAGMGSKQIAKRLTIPHNNSGFKVIEFNTPKFGISSPVNRLDPGFVGYGRTLGGAREFTIPNQLIPSNATIKLIP